MRPTKRSIAALSSAVVALLVCVNPTSSAAPATYTTTQLFGLSYQGNQQGLAYGGGHYYVGFDKKNDVPRAIIEYDATGKEVAKTGALDLGHAAEIGYRKADGNLYVATGGGGTDTVVNVVDMRKSKPKIEDSYTFAKLKGDGMVAVDNVSDHLVVFGGLDKTSHKTALVRFSDSAITSQFDVPDLGTPNGLEVVGDQILYLTYSQKRNIVTAFSFSGVPQYCVPLPVTGEAEGLAADDVTGQLYYGLRSPRSVGRVSPAWRGSLDHNVLVNGTAECGDSGTTNGSVTAVPAWSNVGGMTTIRYGGAGYPSATGSGPEDRGAAFFSGGGKDVATLTQQVPMAGLVKDIRSGQLRYNLGGWLGGYAKQTDRAQVDLTFKDAAGAPVGTGRIGPVTNVDRHDVTTLLDCRTSGPVPRTAVTATVTVTATKDSGSNNDGYSDNISLSFTSDATSVPAACS